MATKQKAVPKRTGLRYIGNGAYLPGLPACDLNAADLVLYATEIAALEAAGNLLSIYEPVEEPVTEETSNA
jgi:hypothetical protein